MLEEIIEKNKAATKYLMSITATGPSDMSTVPNTAKSVEETIDEMGPLIAAGTIPEHEKDTAEEILKTYQELRTNVFNHSKK